jgi:hypothetical protein
MHALRVLGLPACLPACLPAATLPNVGDIGAWLECPDEAVFNFGYQFRPVPLDIHVLGYQVGGALLPPPLSSLPSVHACLSDRLQPAKNAFLFNKYLEARVPDVIARYSDRKPTLVRYAHAATPLPSPPIHPPWACVCMHGVVHAKLSWVPRFPLQVFCDSKKSTETLAARLAETAAAFGAPQLPSSLTDRCRRVANPKLRCVWPVSLHGWTASILRAPCACLCVCLESCVLCLLDTRELLLSGAQVAFHNAGLEADDRATVEALFQECHLRVLCSTSTLAVGLNSPAHTVIIKGGCVEGPCDQLGLSLWQGIQSLSSIKSRDVCTCVYAGTSMWRGSKVGYEELSVSSILQMVGRAGRPGYDDSECVGVFLVALP